MKKFRHIVEYLGVAACLFLAKRLPLAFAGAVARSLGDAFFFLGHKRRKIACDNVKRCKIATEEKEVERIVRASFRHMAVLFVEAIRSPKYFGGPDWRSRVTIEAPPESQAILDDPSQGVIFVSAHLGNWEIGISLMSKIKPVLAMVRQMNNPYVERLVREKTHRSEFTTILKNADSVSRLVRFLKGGGMLGILIDQHARFKPMMVDFFGIPAASHTSVARLHMATKAPICIAFSIRNGPMKYTIHIQPPLKYEKTGDKDKDVRAIIEAIHAELEKMIRRYPEQYLWAHRRWRNV